jgi:hypothetical protein
MYGDYWGNCATKLWNEIGKGDGLKTPAGVSLYDHLRSRGISSLGDREDPKPGTMMYHVRAVEEDFWGNRFGEYGRWKKRMWDDYSKRGYFDGYTGFRYSGPFNRKIVSNYAVQGSAFHVLLWSLIVLNKRLKKYGLKSRIVGQIHDSIIADVVEGELSRFLELARQVMTADVYKEHPWITIPISADADITPPNGSWFDKVTVDCKNDKFYIKDKSFIDTDTLLAHLNTTIK